MKKILVLYAGVGQGHRRISENIAEILKQDGNNVELLNLFALEDGAFTKDGSALYFWIIAKIPWLWRFLYTNKIFTKLTLPFRTFVASFKSQKLQKILEAGNFDLVISTHVNSSAIVSYLINKGVYTGKFAICFSDFHLHRYWIFKNADMFFVNTIEQKEEMLKLGISQETIFVCGITLQAKKSFDRNESRKKYEISTTEKVVLVSGGGTGFGMNEKLIDNILSTGVTAFLLCGRSEKQFHQFSAYYKDNSKVKVMGHLDDLNELYAIADLAIGKPGGLTVTETLQYELPLVVISFIPGQ